MEVVIAATNLDPNFRWAITYGKSKTVLNNFMWNYEN